ncbi:putative oxidoreductase [Saccharata proteae CBS 121410]|uniref:Oxidoreductase n=1 Tax=Saccharata proteae CBS 121410 TaxID=1314787 RepID=A0A9P4HNG4_9PEZI|nr:putative oxidoreductase [Saccharata proteae CBS 121410]
MPYSFVIDSPKALPTIDLGPFLKPENFSNDERKSGLQLIRQACLNHGFFIVTGHGIPRHLQEQILEQARLFFNLPSGEKERLSEKISFGASHRGYQAVRGEALQNDKPPDLKEGFQMGVEKDPSHPDCLAKRMLTGPNVWPEALGLSFSRCMEQYFDAMRNLQDEMMRIVALTLNVDFDKTFGAFCDDSLRGLRLLHYPPQPDETLGAGAHTDFGALTLLLTDGVAGLQIYEDGNWMDVTTEPGTYIVNLGDMMKQMTAGLYKSSLHRVINKSGVSRYSVPCFLDGNLDFAIRPVVEGPDTVQDELTVEQHMMERFGSARDRVNGEVV